MCLTNGPAPPRRYAVYERCTPYNDVLLALTKLTDAAYEHEIGRLLRSCHPSYTEWHKVAVFSTDERRSLWLLANAERHPELRWFTTLEARNLLSNERKNGNAVHPDGHWMLEDDHETDYNLYCH